jgi:opacity protein-like surface antigen
LAVAEYPQDCGGGTTAGGKTAGRRGPPIGRRIENTYHNFPGGAVTEEFSFDHTRWGWTGGIGAEYKLWTNWSVNAEALFMQFRKTSDTFFSPSQVRNVSFDVNDSAWVTRIGVNYRFDPGPVVANY